MVQLAVMWGVNTLLGYQTLPAWQETTTLFLRKTLQSHGSPALLGSLLLCQEAGGGWWGAGSLLCKQGLCPGRWPILLQECGKAAQATREAHGACRGVGAVRCTAQAGVAPEHRRPGPSGRLRNGAGTVRG